MQFLLYCLKITVSGKIPSGYNLACMDPRQNTTVSIVRKVCICGGKKKEFSEKLFLKNVHPTVMWVIQWHFVPVVLKIRVTYLISNSTVIF